HGRRARVRRHQEQAALHLDLRRRRARRGEDRRRGGAARARRTGHFTPSASFTALIVKLPFGPKPMTWPFTMYVGVELMPMSNACETCSSSAARSAAER